MTLQESALQEVLPIGHFEASSKDQEAFNNGPDTTRATSDHYDEYLDNSDGGIAHQEAMDSEGCKDGQKSTENFGLWDGAEWDSTTLTESNMRGEFVLARGANSLGLWGLHRDRIHFLNLSLAKRAVDCIGGNRFPAGGAGDRSDRSFAVGTLNGSRGNLMFADGARDPLGGVGNRGWGGFPRNKLFVTSCAFDIGPRDDFAEVHRNIAVRADDFHCFPFLRPLQLIGLNLGVKGRS